MTQPANGLEEAGATRREVTLSGLAPTEPTTARALWPTFMRRTLTEDALHPRALHTPAE
jgi:hypothetical protein